MTAFNYVELGAEAWKVVADPSAGWIVHARVSNTGDWVEITHLGYSDH